MGKQESVDARKQSYMQAQDQALSDFGSGCYDDGVQSVPPVVGQDPDEQAKIDAAVQQAVQPLNDKIASMQSQIDKDAQDLKDAQDKASSDLAAVQQALSDMTAKEQLEEQAVADIKAKAEDLQKALDVIKGLLS